MQLSIPQIELLEDTHKLNEEVMALRQQLWEANETIASVKKQHIDAWVMPNDMDLTVYTENSADKSYRILVEKMNEGAVTLNSEGTILYCNSSFAKMINRPLQNVIGLPFDNFTVRPTKGHFTPILEQGINTELKEEWSLYTNDQKIIPVLLSVNNLWINDKLLLSVILTDLTVQLNTQNELKRRTIELEQKNFELEHANKDLMAFTYLSSHDLQEPLRKIQNFVTCVLAEEASSLTENGKKYLEKTTQTANRMRALIDDLLTYAETKIDERKFEITNMGVILTEVFQEMEEVILEKKAVIKTATSCELKIIPFQFRQLVRNLISNSLKFAKPGVNPQIAIKSETGKGSDFNIRDLKTDIEYCHITYVDNGIGFETQYQEKIFEVFKRLHTKEKYPGTGMGLTICKRIVENHGGVITATGKLNEGARFDIYLPKN